MIYVWLHTPHGDVVGRQVRWVPRIGESVVLDCEPKGPFRVSDVVYALPTKTRKSRIDVHLGVA